MIRAIVRTAGVAAVSLAACLGGASASALPVNRPLADEMTQQYNQQELRQLQASDVRVYVSPEPVRGNVVPLGPPEAPFPSPRPPGPPPPGWPYPPH